MTGHVAKCDHWVEVEMPLKGGQSLFVPCCWILVLSSLELNPVLKSVCERTGPARAPYDENRQLGRTASSSHSSCALSWFWQVPGPRDPQRLGASPVFPCVCVSSAAQVFRLLRPVSIVRCDVQLPAHVPGDALPTNQSC